jgi:hypothetical protein
MGVPGGPVADDDPMVREALSRRRSVLLLALGVCVFVFLGAGVLFSSVASHAADRNDYSFGNQALAVFLVFVAFAAIIAFVNVILLLRAQGRLRRLLAEYPWTLVTAHPEQSESDAMREASRFSHHGYLLLVDGPGGREAVELPAKARGHVDGSARLAGPARGAAVLANTSNESVWRVTRLGPVVASTPDAQQQNVELHSAVPITNNEPAANQPWTKRRMRRYVAWALLAAIGGAVLITVGIRGIIEHNAHVSYLRKHGLRADAVVVDTYYCTGKCTPWVEFGYTYEGRTYEAKVSASGSHYDIGDHDTVFFLDSNPGDAVTSSADEQNGAGLPLTGMFFGLILAAIGIVGLAIAEGRSRLLHRTTWQPCTFVIAHRARGRYDPTLVGVRPADAAQGEIMQLTSTQKVHDAPVHGLVADDGGTRVLLADDHAPPRLLSARRTTSESLRLRWQAKANPGAMAQL